MDLVNNLGKQVDKVLKMKNVKLVVVLCIALYAGAIAPALPNAVIEFFDTIPGKLMFLFVIGYMASRDVQVALMIAVAFLLTLHIYNKRVGETYRNVFERFNTDTVCDPLTASGEAVCEATGTCEWDDTTDPKVCKPKDSFTNPSEEATEGFDDDEGEDFANQDDSIEGFSVMSGSTSSANYSPL